MQQPGVWAEMRSAWRAAHRWTRGRYDLVGIGEFPDDETGSAAALAIGSQGSIRSETLRAFTAEQMQRILDKMP